MLDVGEESVTIWRPTERQSRRQNAHKETTGSHSIEIGCTKQDVVRKEGNPAHEACGEHRLGKDEARELGMKSVAAIGRSSYFVRWCQRCNAS